MKNTITTKGRTLSQSAYIVAMVVEELESTIEGWRKIAEKKLARVSNDVEIGQIKPESSIDVKKSIRARLFSDERELIEDVCKTYEISPEHITRVGWFDLYHKKVRVLQCQDCKQYFLAPGRKCKVCDSYKVIEVADEFIKHTDEYKNDLA